MISDSYFEIGNTHMVCQDYALNGCSPDGKMYYSIISDGCSSSKYSEIGSQILCNIAKYYLLSFYKTGVINELSEYSFKQLLQENIYKRADELRIFYNLEHSSLDATLFITFMIKNTISNNTYVYGWGDGVIILNYNNFVKLIEYEYESGAPFYLSYLKQDRFEMYKEKFGDKTLKETIIIYNNKEIISTEEHILECTYQPSLFVYKNPHELKSVIIGSDGLTSYITDDNSSIPIISISKDLLAYKRITGEFMKSNIIFMNKRLKKAKHAHYDDMSVGIVLREK